MNRLVLALCGAAFRWETPPVTDTTITRPFEFVRLDSPGLASHPDPRPFAEHFGAACEEGIVVFPNLGRDAIMVVPRPLTSPSAYGHLAAFVRNAPEAQWHALWRIVGQAMQLEIEERYGGITSTAVSTIRRKVRDGKYPIVNQMVRKLTRGKLNS